jgi:hypothetical protein
VRDKEVEEQGSAASADNLLQTLIIYYKTRRSGDEFYVLCQRDAGQSV